jgi:serine/threonine protein kinase
MMSQSQSVLLIDPRQQHRQVIRQYIGRTHPDLRLIEKEPTSFEQVAASVRWSDYDVLLIDNQLGKEDGLQWVRRFQSDQDFPPVIFISSTHIESTGANLQVQAGLQLGARGFLFKEQIDTEVFAECLSKALAIRSGRLTKAALTTSSANDEAGPTSVSLKDTFHEMQHARALLHGQENWPFSVQQLQAGNAEIAGYRIQEYLGQTDGCFSFKGCSLSDQQTCVLKLIDTPPDAVEQYGDDWARYLQSVLGWSNPYLAQWMDYRQLDAHVLIAQEAIQGDTLSCRLRKAGVTPAQAVTCFRQLLQALSQLHHQGQRVGMLSPHHLSFRSYEHLVLTHFDYAGLFSGSGKPCYQDLTHHEALYLSPEIFQNQPCDWRSDLYIAGVILYYMMSGRPPYGQSSTHAVLSAHVSSPVPLLRDRKHPLNRVIGGLMEKSPDDRIQSADEALEILDDLIQRGKVAALK